MVLIYITFYLNRHLKLFRFLQTTLPVWEANNSPMLACISWRSAMHGRSAHFLMHTRTDSGCGSVECLRVAVTEHICRCISVGRSVAMVLSAAHPQATLWRLCTDKASQAPGTFMTTDLCVLSGVLYFVTLEDGCERPCSFVVNKAFSVWSDLARLTLKKQQFFWSTD